MSTRDKTVLLFQPSKFQAEIWSSVFAEYNINLIWQENWVHKKHLANYFETLTAQPHLVIIDLKIDNNDEIRQCFRDYYPSLPIILTVDPGEECLPYIRFCVKNQGINELLINFQQENLLTRVTTNINSVFKYLNYPSVPEEHLAEALESLDNNSISSITPYQPQTAIQLKEENQITKTLSKIIPKNISSIPLPSLFVGILLFIAIVVETNIFSLIFPIERLQSQMLGNREKQLKTTSNNILSLKQLSEIPQGTFNYGGSTTWASIRKIAHSPIQKEYPKFNLRYLSPIAATPGSGTGIRMLLEEELDFSHSSRPIKQEEHILAWQKGFTLKEYHVAIDAIAIAVNPSLKVSGLTVEQLQKIYLGQITNWKEVNGPDLEIIPFSRRPKDGGTPEFFRHHVLRDQSFGNNVKSVYSTTDGLKQLAKTPGGIYYASAPQIVPQCKVKALPIASEKGKNFIPPYLPPAIATENCPKQRNQINVETIKNAVYPITRYLSVIVKEDGTRAQKAGEAYVQLLTSKEIQQLIEKAGFVSIH